MSDRPHPHRRFNPLRGEWVVVSAERTSRPWQGQIEPEQQNSTSSYDASCYLCPGNVRANGAQNPVYTGTFAFDNDFAALQSTNPDVPATSDPLLYASPERGICRVVSFSPRHDVALPRMTVAAIRDVIDAWLRECEAIAEVPWAQYALVFENRGALMGASNPHPHCQIWATEHVPNDPAREREMLARYHAQRAACLLCDYVAIELDRRERIVYANEHFVALVPFWAVWPFETMIVARAHVAALERVGNAGRDALADLLKKLTRRYDNLFETPFPYSMGFHQALRADDAPHDHLHAHFYPPLLRSATVRKFMVGFELLGSAQRDLTAEEAARRLQTAGDDHYGERVARHPE
jgi:UDPglucose--hexose-1-phosphate uridylyltransferase